MLCTQTASGWPFGCNSRVSSALDRDGAPPRGAEGIERQHAVQHAKSSPGAMPEKTVNPARDLIERKKGYHWLLNGDSYDQIRLRTRPGKPSGSENPLTPAIPRACSMSVGAVGIKARRPFIILQLLPSPRPTQGTSTIEKMGRNSGELCPTGLPGTSRQTCWNGKGLDPARRVKWEMSCRSRADSVPSPPRCPNAHLT